MSASDQELVADALRALDLDHLYDRAAACRRAADRTGPSTALASITIVIGRNAISVPPLMA